jgi:hypothetical protein
MFSPDPEPHVIVLDHGGAHGAACASRQVLA